MKGIVLSSITNENEQENILAVLRYLSVFKKFGCSEYNTDNLINGCPSDRCKFEYVGSVKTCVDK